MPSYYIHIAGQVQGIGFRPFIYRQAKMLGITGWVMNTTDGLHIKVQGQKEIVQRFYEKITNDPPTLAQIKRKFIRKIIDEHFDDFQIRKEGPANYVNKTILMPDLAMCISCKEEMKRKEDKRVDYAFITCTNCGPRYSILEKSPYDRENTSMASFEMCDNCMQEYVNPNNRRFYSQTNSCPRCAIVLELYDVHNGSILKEPEQILKLIITNLKKGGIIAVKGIGGYLLICDASNVEVVLKLRKKKMRPSKPFALMYPSIESVEEGFVVSLQARNLLLSPEAPIVTLPVKKTIKSGIDMGMIAPKLNRMGVVLPYAPLFELLLSRFSKPVVATSANVSDSAIIYRNEDAKKNLSGIADFILGHNREVMVPQDDSVVQFSSKHSQKIILRRSRGLSPTFFYQDLEIENKVLALGADLKGAFAFNSSAHIYVSQYLGNLSYYENAKNYKYVLDHLIRIFGFSPEKILVDKHPEYCSVQIGNELAKRYSIPIIAVQHHEAHFAAVLAENNLLDQQQPVLGVIWDGTGFGNDGTVRGGEFLKYDQYQISLMAQIRASPHILGDKMTKEPRIAALAICNNIEKALKILRRKFTEREWEVYLKVLQNKNNLHTTSVGRIFDTIACLTGICDIMTYEGEAAMILESVASNVDWETLEGYDIGDIKDSNFPIAPLLNNILDDIYHNVEVGVIAAKFHISLTEIIKKTAMHFRFQRIAFSGGVFQNGLLVDMIIDRLGSQFGLYFHCGLSPNDECISFGQISRILIEEKRQQKDRQTISLAF